MKTITVSIDEPTLAALDALARRAAREGSRRQSRPEMVREALVEFIARRETEELHVRERTILSHNKKKLAAQARALLREQAAP